MLERLLIVALRELAGPVIQLRQAVRRGDREAAKEAQIDLDIAVEEELARQARKKLKG